MYKNGIFDQRTWLNRVILIKNIHKLFSCSDRDMELINVKFRTHQFPHMQNSNRLFNSNKTLEENCLSNN